MKSNPHTYLIRAGVLLLMAFTAAFAAGLALPPPRALADPVDDTATAVAQTEGVFATQTTMGGATSDAMTATVGAALTGTAGGNATYYAGETATAAYWQTQAVSVTETAAYYLTLTAMPSLTPTITATATPSATLMPTATPGIPTAPLLDRPLNGAIFFIQDIPFLTWIPTSSDSYSFQLQVSVNKNFNQNTVVQDDMLQSTIQPFYGSYKKGDYYWRVRAANINNEFGPWSEVWKFSTTLHSPLGQ